MLKERESSYDTTGANADFIVININESYKIFDIKASGIIKHIWMTLNSPDEYYLRKILLKMWWDNEKNPSVEVPIGDFFGIGHGKTVNFWSLPLSMGPNDGKGFNCFFPMPFSQRARIEIINETNVKLVCYYYIDYEEQKSIGENLGRFHVLWRRENPCKGNNYNTSRKVEFNHKKNINHEDDYLILDAEGEGQYVGCHLDIHNLYETNKHNWSGEGDDYIEIDDAKIILYGTGTEDYFCGAWCPTQTYNSPYYGVTLPGGENWRGKISYYRYHIQDPIYFHKNIKVKIEHGHANQRSDDWSSTAYWYQKEPHKYIPILNLKQRIPRKDPKEIN